MGDEEGFFKSDDKLEVSQNTLTMSLWEKHLELLVS